MIFFKKINVLSVFLSDDFDTTFNHLCIMLEKLSYACAFHGCILNCQENWYMEWHFDVLIVWTLAKTGEISKAEDLLKGLKNRWKCYILQNIIEMQCCMNCDILMLSYCRFLRMTKKKQQRMQRGMMVCFNSWFHEYMKISLDSMSSS